MINDEKSFELIYRKMNCNDQHFIYLISKFGELKDNGKAKIFNVVKDFCLICIRAQCIRENCQTKQKNLKRIMLA